MDYKGVLIKESLQDRTILAYLDVTDTVVEPVVEEDKTPWLESWTLVGFTIPEGKAEKFAVELSQALEAEHGDSWYADFKNERWHYVVFRGRVFKVDRQDPKGYGPVRAYGISLGIPERQLDFSPDVIVG